MDIEKKLSALKHYIKQLGSTVVAFSGGVDSTFLLKICFEVLGNKVLAVTARSSMYPDRELSQAVNFANNLGIKHFVIESEELDIEGFSQNPTNRCYLCKRELFEKIIKIASDNGIPYILDGSNSDDTGDYRPGMIALKELGVKSPLRETGLTKEEIRILSKRLGLETWDKPSFACLASRFPYGNRISREKLALVNQSEEYLLSLGFKAVRVRHHGDIARIEVDPAERPRFFDVMVMDDIYRKFTSLGFKYVTLDLKGYRTGSMNEVLKAEDKMTQA